MAGGVPASRAAAGRHLPGLVDRRQLLHLDRPSRRPAAPGASSRKRARRSRQPNGDAAAAARAREEVLIAEGSDWFWWYGDDHSSEHDLEFDDLFRRHLRNVYRLLGKPIPDELFVSNISAGAPPATERQPTALLAPVLDGEETSYFEWLGAGLLEVRDTAGAMHQSDRRPPVLSAAPVRVRPPSGCTSAWTASGRWWTSSAKAMSSA